LLKSLQAFRSDTLSGVLLPARMTEIEISLPARSRVVIQVKNIIEGFWFRLCRMLAARIHDGRLPEVGRNLA